MPTMTLEVLKSEKEIAKARLEMRGRGVSRLPDPWVCRILKRAGLSGFLHGDYVKSWDVWRTAFFLEKHLSKELPVIDLGAYKSEILPVLYRLGYTRLHGVDLNPRLRTHPHQESIQYTVCDFFSTPFESGSFSAVTSISAIEHGLNLPKLLSEVSRLLRPGGFFLCSTDYWPEKLDSTGINMLGMEWTIFSNTELRWVLDSARAVGLDPVGPLDFEAAKPVIRCSGKAYTFAWFVLIKR